MVKGKFAANWEMTKGKFAAKIYDGSVRLTRCTNEERYVPPSRSFSASAYMAPTPAYNFCSSTFHKREPPFIIKGILH